MTGFRWRFLWTVALGTLCLVTLCVFTAVSLFEQQAAVTGVLRENVASRRAAADLRGCLNILIEREKHLDESVADLHARAQVHVAEIDQYADHPEERVLAEPLATGFARYLDLWQSLPPLPPPSDPGHAAKAAEHAAKVAEATQYLEVHVLHPCREIEGFNDGRVDETTGQLERVLNQLAWGMAVIAGLGAVAGVVFGYGVARVLSRSIRRLRVQIRDAAGKLDPDQPEILLTGDAGFGGLHDELESLTGRIEGVVQKLHAREREVIRAEQLAAVGQLAAGVGHEIRNPLTSIKLLVQAAIEAPRRAALTDHDLRVIEQEVRRIESSLQTFLDFARPSRTERRLVDLQEVLGAVAGLVRGRAEKQRVAVRVETPPGQIPILAYPGQFRQVFMNLALNALDAMPAGGTLALRVRESNPGRLEVEVADTGPGIPREMLPRLFQPFASTKDTGLGLGLTISRRIVEDHGGTLDAENRPGGGASFFVRLPVGD
jgi:signal transduction histidine kinase